VHDVSDILVDTLKMVNYLKLEDRRGWYASELAYVACIVGWVWWRLWQFPTRVIRGSLVEAYRVLAPLPRFADGLLGMAPPDLPMWAEMNGLLITLQALHVYWAHLFFMIGYRICTESAREASRQEYEGMSDDEADGASPGGGRGLARRLKAEAAKASTAAAAAVVAGADSVTDATTLAPPPVGKPVAPADALGASAAAGR